MLPKSPLKAEWGFVIRCNLSSPSHNSKPNLASRLPCTHTCTLTDLDTHTHAQTILMHSSQEFRISKSVFLICTFIYEINLRQSVLDCRALDHRRADLSQSCKDDAAKVNPLTKTYHSESYMSMLQKQEEGAVPHNKIAV